MRSHIDITSDADIAFWCDEFGVRPIEIISAAQAVGGSARLVAQYLEMTTGDQPTD